jgi:hypothetical protein
MRVKILHAAVAGALLTVAGVAQAGGGGHVSSSSGQQLVCDQPLSRGQNSCVLQSPGAAPQRVAVVAEPIGAPSEQGVIVRPEGAAVTQPNASISRGSNSGVIESSPHTSTYILEPVGNDRFVVRERVAMSEPIVVPAPDGRNDAFPDPSPPSVAPTYPEPRVIEPRSGNPRGGVTGPERPRSTQPME